MSVFEPLRDVELKELPNGPRSWWAKELIQSKLDHSNTTHYRKL